MSEEVKTSNPEDVKKQEEETKAETKSDDSKLTKEEFERLQELEKNKSIALKQEREEKKALQEKLAEFEAKEKAEAEKEAKKKGQYEELLAKKDEEIKTLAEKALAFDKLQEERQKELKTKLDELTGKVGDEVIKDNSDILEELSDEKKIKFLEKMLSTNEAKGFDGEAKKSDDQKVNDFEVLKEKLSKGKITPTERANYLNLLRQQKD